MIHLVVVEDSSKAKFGGGQRVTLELLRAIEGKAQLSLFDFARESVFLKKARDIVSDQHHLIGYGKIAGGARSSFSIGPLELLLAPFCFIINFLQMLAFLLLHRRGEIVIYAATKKALFVAYFVNLIFRTPYIFHAHAVDSRTSIFSSLLHYPLTRARTILCVSKVVASNIDLPNCRVVYNPVSNVDGRVKSYVEERKQPFRVAVLATLIPLKGIDYFLASYSLLHRQSEVQYYVFGDGPERRRLEAAYAADGIRFFGFEKEIQKILRDQVDLVVIPSIVPEAAPMAAAEAFSVGVPVVTTNIGGQAEIVSDGINGITVPIADAQALAEAIDYLTASPEIMEKLSIAALNAAREFSIENFEQAVRDAILGDVDVAESSCTTTTRLERS